MRQVNDSLDAALQSVEAQFIQHQRNQNGNDQIENNLQHGNEGRIEKDRLTVIQLEHILKVLQAHPGRSQNTLTGIKTLKRHHHAEHGDDLVYEHPEQPG